MFILKQKSVSKFVFKFMQVSTLPGHLQGTILDATYYYYYYFVLDWLHHKTGLKYTVKCAKHETRKYNHTTLVP